MTNVTCVFCTRDKPGHVHAHIFPGSDEHFIALATGGNAADYIAGFSTNQNAFYGFVRSLHLMINKTLPYGPNPLTSTTIFFENINVRTSPSVDNKNNHKVKTEELSYRRSSSQGPADRVNVVGYGVRANSRSNLDVMMPRPVPDTLPTQLRSTSAPMSECPLSFYYNMTNDNRSRRSSRSLDSRGLIGLIQTGRWGPKHHLRKLLHKRSTRTTRTPKYTGGAKVALYMKTIFCRIFYS